MSLSDLFDSLLGDDDMSAASTTLPPAIPTTVMPTTETVSVEIETRRPTLQNTGSFEDVNTEPSNANDYVKFNVQQPNVNMIQFKPVPSMNNIIISPNQNSATFVLGSQQTVGPGVFVGTAEKDSFYQQPADNPKPPAASNPNQYQYGTIFNDMSMPALKPQGFTQQQPPQLPHQSPPPAINVGQDSMKKETDGAIRFPSNVNFDNAPVVTGTFSNDINLPNGHGAPIALPQNSNNLVIFPPNSQSVETTVGAQHQTVGSDYLDNNSNLVSFSIDSSNNFHQLHQPNDNGVNPNFNAINNMNDNVQLQTAAYQGAPNRESAVPGPPAPDQQLPQLGPVDQSGFGQLSHGLTPPHDDQGRRPPFSDRNQIRQGVAAPGGRQPPPFNRNEFNRKPLDGLHRPPTNNGDRPLPNILPQFRPNAKIGSGQNANREPPNRGSQKFGFRQQPQVSQQRIQQVEHQMTRQRPPGSAPPHFRRAPPPTYSPTSFNAKMAPAAPSAEQIDASRRYYQIRQSIANDRVFGPAPPQSPPNRRYIDGYPSQRNADLGVFDNQPDTYLPVYQNSGEFTRNAYNLPQQQQQQQPVTEQLFQNQLEDRTGKLEPVVTLQMLQHLKQLQKDSNNNGQPQPVQSVSADAPVSVQTASDKPPVYVVYPVKTSPVKLDVLDTIGEDDVDPVVVGQRGEQPPLPPADINSITATAAGTGPNVYQNTPFTVIRQEQKPILMAKNKQSKVQFPYALEKPTTLIKALAADKAKQTAPKYGFYDDSGESYNIGEGPAGETVMSRVVTGNMAAYSGTHENNGGDEDDAAISTKLTR